MTNYVGQIKFERDRIKVMCNVCGREMEICSVEPPYYAHCLNRDCEAMGKNSIVFSGFLDAQIIAEDWLLQKLHDSEWLKKDALEWLNDIWREYQQWCRDNY